MAVFYAMVERVDRSRFHAATVRANSLDEAKKAFIPDYGFGVLWLNQIPSHHINPSALKIG